MKKEEFLQGLSQALSGQVPPELVRENLRYYEDYIRTEQEKGRPESEIMEELGSPRLIARTIIDTTPGAGEGGYEEGGPGSSQSFAGSSQNGGYQQSGGIRYYDLNKWYWKLLGILLVIAVVTLVLMIVGGILSLVIPLLPVIGLVLFIMWILQRGPWGSEE